MQRNQILIHFRNNKYFSIDDLIHIESFLCDQDSLHGVVFDGHDHGFVDSNIFLISDEIERTVDLIAKVIEARSPGLNFAIGAKAEGVEADYDVIVCRGIYEIIMQ